MKLKVILIGIALILFSVLQAQIKKETFEKAVDILNCKTVELSLPVENVQEYKQQCPCEKSDYKEINEFLISVNLDATLALSKEVESLKKTFNENWKKEEVVSFLSKSIFTDKKYQKIVAFASKREGQTDFNNFKSRLKTDLENTFPNSDPMKTVIEVNTEVQQPSLEDRILELENNTKKVGSGFLGGLLEYLIMFSVLLAVFSLYFSLRKHHRKDNEVSNEVKNFVRKKIEDINWNKNTSNINVGSSELKDANNRIRDLESQIEKIKTQLNTSNTVSIITSNSANQETKQPEMKVETFFLSTPNSDSSFNESSASLTYKDGATIYLFTKIGSNKVKFQIDEKEASAKLALQFPDKNIDPVCDAVNAFNPKASRITTVENGEAELQNGKWILIKKAKIKYEN